MTKDVPLLGTWSLLAWYNKTPDGRRLYPLGEDATGYISYSEDGFVFVHLSARERPAYAVNDPFHATHEEHADAMVTHITYAGPYTFHGTYVVHHVTQASCPNWIGTDQKRDVTFVGDRLRLSAEGAVFQGQTVTAVVDWIRARS